MKPQMMLNNHDPENGEWGDCDRACLASILEMDPEDVPHFYEGASNDQESPENFEFWFRRRQWLRQQGWDVIPHSLARPLDDILLDAEALDAYRYWLLIGKSRTGVAHTVVCLGGEIIHDPSPVGAGIVGPLETDDGLEYYGTEILAGYRKEVFL